MMFCGGRSHQLDQNYGLQGSVLSRFFFFRRGRSKFEILRLEKQTNERFQFFLRWDEKPVYTLMQHKTKYKPGVLKKDLWGRQIRRIRKEMEEAIKEHQCKSISFSMVEESSDQSAKRNQNDSRNKVRRGTLEIMAIPSVTLSPRKLRDRHQSEGRRFCRWRCMFRMIVLLLPLVFYKEILAILSLVPQTVSLSNPSIKHDYSSIRGINDLNSQIVQPKCFKHIVDCPCQDPLQAVKEEFEDWDITFQKNKALSVSERGQKANVVFYGDSITEGWRGTQFGKEWARAEGAPEVFDTLFSTDTGSIIDGIALGIAGDKTNNLLWRLQNGELQNVLNPSVFWLLIGTNDIGNTFCSPEMVVVGIVRIVEEIKFRRPNAHIVVNGLLPRTFNQEGYVTKGGTFKPTLWNDLKAINGELNLYATYREGVSYFDTKVFFTNPDTNNENELQIDKELMSDYLHPTARGYQVWGNEISDTVRRLIPDI